MRNSLLIVTIVLLFISCKRECLDPTCEILDVKQVGDTVEYTLITHNPNEKECEFYSEIDVYMYYLDGEVDWNRRVITTMPGETETTFVKHESSASSNLDYAKIAMKIDHEN